MTDYATVVVLSYQRPAFLARCLDALRANDPGYPMEIVVVDDGTWDEDSQEPAQTGLTARRLINSELAFGRISSAIFNSGKNLGVGHGFMRGVGLARGQYVVKMDQDVIVKPGWLGRSVEILESFQDIAAVGLFRYYVDPVDHRKMTLGIEERGSVKAEIVQDFVSSAAVMRRTDLLKSPWSEFSQGCGEDVVWKEVQKAIGKRLALTPEDMAENIGFGVPHSTLVKPSMKVRAVHELPRLFWALKDGSAPGTLAPRR